jgi:ribosomal protein S27AE
MATIKVSCPECKTKNKVSRDKKVFNCKKCGYTVFNNAKTKERFKMLRKITGASNKNSSRKREGNLNEIRNGIGTLYTAINEDLGKNKLSDAEKKTLQLFNFDNTFDNKYLILFLLKLNVSNTQDAYDAFKKLKTKKKSEMLNSSYFQRLHNNPLYRPLIDDIIVHSFHKKRKKADRLAISIMTRN